MMCVFKKRCQEILRPLVRVFPAGFLLKFLLLSVLTVFLLVLVAQIRTESAAKTGTSSVSGEEISAGYRMRVVWVQDMGDGRDVDTVGENLRLMGLEAGDRNGERAILGDTGNYAKPLITPRGDRVVFTDRIRKKIFLVNWDGSGLKELFDGVGLALWRDPRDGREWIYYGHEEMQKGGFTCPAVYRTQLDRPGPGELVWNKVPVNVDSFQVSADGRIAGGNFPWPAGGVAELPNKSIRIFTKGCWTALASAGGKSFYWIFDGAHRNLTIFDLQDNNRKWQVNINGAPGIRGHEVYHPRWSNHPRFMAMTGPYTVGSGANRISGGGREVEIYVGRFNADLTAIESWWKATQNDRGDFFPDIWVAPVEGAKKDPDKIPAMKKEGSMSPASKKTDSRKKAARLVIEGRLTDVSVIPAPKDIAPYRRALLVNGYRVLRVLSGSYPQKKIMVAHWVIEDGQVLKDAKRDKGKTFRMVLERYDDHPELEGERLIMDSDEFKLPLYYELRH